MAAVHITVRLEKALLTSRLVLFVRRSLNALIISAITLRWVRRLCSVLRIIALDWI